jgi:adenylate kinase
MGAPGSGKGTQAKALASKNPGWVHISTGDLFRKEISSGSPLGTSIRDILAHGKLVSDDVTNEVFESQVLQLLQSLQPNVLLLDGYPRTENQARFLVDFCKKRASELQAPVVVEMDIAEGTVVARLADRLINPRTGRIYHRISNPPKVAGICDDDGGPLLQRPDDQPETIRSRYQLYRKERDGIVRGLGGSEIVKHVSAELPPAQVTVELSKLIGSPTRAAG